MTQLFINIKELIQVRETTIEKVSGKEMGRLPTLKNAYLRVEDDLIVDFGLMETLQKKTADKRLII